MIEFPDLVSLIREGVKYTPHQTWPTYDGKNLDRNKYVTASESSRCLRRIWFSKHLPQVNAYAAGEGWGFFERGHNIESWAVQQIEQALRLEKFNDLEIMNYGDAQVSYHWGFQAGTPDALVRWQGDLYVGDFKSVDPRINTGRLPKPENTSQIQQNIDLVRRCLEEPVTGGFLVYINASNYEVMFQKNLAVDEAKISTLENRARRVMTAASADSLPAEGMWMDDGCKYCEFTKQCNEVGNLDDEHHDNIIEEAERAMQDVFKGS